MRNYLVLELIGLAYLFVFDVFLRKVFPIDGFAGQVVAISLFITLIAVILVLPALIILSYKDERTAKRTKQKPPSNPTPREYTMLIVGFAAVLVIYGLLPRFYPGIDTSMLSTVIFIVIIAYYFWKNRSKK